jgi:Cysteine dioxygenase type I
MTTTQIRFPSPRSGRNTRQITLQITTVLDVLRDVSAAPDFAARVGSFDPEALERQWIDLPGPAGVDLWLIFWPADSRTGWHDHGTASGAFKVVSGSLTECTYDGVVHARTLPSDAGRGFGASHIHDVVNTSGEPAVSLHAYTPSLSTMTRYHLHRGHLQVAGVESAGQW